MPWRTTRTGGLHRPDSAPTGSATCLRLAGEVQGRLRHGFRPAPPLAVTQVNYVGEPTAWSWVKPWQPRTGCQLVMTDFTE